MIYDPQETHYEQLLDTFFQHVDPTTKDRQGGDRGTQYRSAIYYHTPEQKAATQRVSEAEELTICFVTELLLTQGCWCGCR